MRLISVPDDSSTPATQETDVVVRPATKRRRIHISESSDEDDKIEPIVQQQEELRKIAQNAMAAAEKALVSEVARWMFMASLMLYSTGRNNNVDSRCSLREGEC